MNYDKSLILLKIYLCRKMKDTLYIPLKIKIYLETFNKSLIKVTEDNQEQETLSVIFKRQV